VQPVRGHRRQGWPYQEMPRPPPGLTTSRSAPPIWRPIAPSTKASSACSACPNTISASSPRIGAAAPCRSTLRAGGGDAPLPGPRR
jgi:hypothetical protein